MNGVKKSKEIDAKLAKLGLEKYKWRTFTFQLPFAARFRKTFTEISIYGATESAEHLRAAMADLP